MVVVEFLLVSSSPSPAAPGPWADWGDAHKPPPPILQIGPLVQIHVDGLSEEVSINVLATLSVVNIPSLHIILLV